MTGAAPTQPASRTVRFLHNVLWSWIGVAFAILAGLVLSPITIRQLGEEGYGIWALVFALIDYYDILDFGFRSAVVKYTAHYRALDEPEQVYTVINTALVYFSLIGAIVMLGTLLVFRSLHALFQITPPFRPQFATLILLVGFSWSLGAVCHSFSATLEGYQRFDLSNRAWITYTGVRSIGCLVVLLMGYGLVPLGIMVVSSQVLLYVLNYRNFQEILPDYRFKLRGAQLSMLRKLAAYGSHTFLANSSWQVATQAPSILIGHFLPAAFVGFYAAPNRLIRMAVDVTDRVTSVSNSNTAELAARDEMDTVARMGILVNRYCLTMFLPVAVMLWVYRSEVMEVWIRKPAYVTNSAPLLPIFLLGAIFVLVGQSNSSSILYGLGKHQGYARGLLVEACVSVAALVYAIPRYGIMGAAVVPTVLMILNRGIYTPWYLCRVLHFSFGRYMAGAYARPLLTAVPLMVVAYALKTAALPGRNLFEIAAASAIIGCAGWSLAFFTALEEEHRALFVEMFASRLGRLSALLRKQAA